LHQNEISSVEAHSQTVHKLVLVNDYGGACCGIIAQQARRYARAMHITLVDVFAGAGQHQSVTDPDGVRKGTALIFTTIGRHIQRAHPTVRVHVRLNDLDAGAVERLRERVEHYRSGFAPSDNVDVVVTQGDAGVEIVKAAREAARRGGFALLLVDPYGMPPPLESLAAAAGGAGWHEMLVNLDVGGMFRLGRAALTDTASSAADAAFMDRLFGGDSWRDAFEGNPPWSNDALEHLARTYAECFSETHSVREVYRLFSSDNQVRFMVHLAKHEKARTEFRKSYDRSLTAGLFQGKRLSEADRAKIAGVLFEQLRGTTTTLEDVFDAGMVAFDRGQLRHVFRTAEDRGYGHLDGDVMEWFEERLALAPFKPAQQLDFGLGA
jgi:three-Cys-motif partner protein